MPFSCADLNTKPVLEFFQRRDVEVEGKMVLICVSPKLNINVPELNNSHRKSNFINAL